jgi:hypothetical protein
VTKVTKRGVLNAIGLPAAVALLAGATACNQKPGPPITAPLSGCPRLGYMTPVTIGASTSFQLLIDTGSSTTAVASRACTDCSMISPLYNPGAAATNDKATASTTYGDGSGWSGSVYKDSVRIDAVSTAVPLNFVAIDNQSGFFRSTDCSGAPMPDADQGILGLGPSDLEAPGTDAFVPAFSKAISVPALFSVELCSTSGTLTIGDYPPDLPAPDYTPVVISNYYGVNLSQVDLGQTTIGTGTATFGAVVVDTGTGAIGMPQALFNAFAEALQADPVYKQLSGDSPDWFAAGSCIGATEAQINALPEMTFTFPDGSGGTFALKRPALNSYILPFPQNDTISYCTGIFVVPQMILGAPVMTDLVTVFDIQNRRIGFIQQSSCQ